jgi:uncharacterized Zn-binding protein involved in type VI secretion
MACKWSGLGSALPCPAGRSGPWPPRTGAPQASATERDRTLGSCWVRAAPGPKGLRGSPAVTTGQHESQVDGYPTQAAGMRQAGRSDCGPEGRRIVRATSTVLITGRVLRICAQ